MKRPRDDISECGDGGEASSEKQVTKQNYRTLYHRMCSPNQIEKCALRFLFTTDEKLGKLMILPGFLAQIARLFLRILVS